MNSTLRTLHRLSEVRHLLVQGDDLGAQVLSSLINGVRTEIDRGPVYKMEEKADSLMQEWMKEGFEYRNESGPPVFEPLRDILALAKLMGYTSVTHRQHLASVPLDRWHGCKDRNDDDYEYGYTGLTIYAQPKVTAKHGVNMVPRTNEEFFAELKKAVQIRKGLGPDREFLLD